MVHTKHTKPKALVLYHYLHPDDVVSARHFDGFCESLVLRGWDVEAWPSNHGCRNENEVYPSREDWNGVHIRRVKRPNWRQAANLGRVFNSLWMLSTWTLRLVAKRTDADVIIIGTDPILSVLLAISIKRIRPVPVVHWCFDLYPEAAIADGLLPARGIRTEIIRWFLRRAYRSCDVIVDLGRCMRERIDAYNHCADRNTLVPWALIEPVRALPEEETAKSQLFGSASALALLYSGNFGKAHSFEDILDLAEALISEDVRFCFSVRGNRQKELFDAIKNRDLPNVSTAPFVEESELLRRLAAADIHLVSLQESWTGAVVPSKFFGSLAAGRPVVFAGSSRSAIAHWIDDHRVGWVLNKTTIPATATALRRLKHDRIALKLLQAHCHSVYIKYFSKTQTMDTWDRLLRRIGNVGP